MLAVGLCNICGSFVRSMPVTGSFTRTAINNSSGVKTPFGGIITGSLVLLACHLLTSTIKYIPKATLAAVIMIAMFYMFETHVFVLLWRTKSKILIIYQYFLFICIFNIYKLRKLISLNRFLCMFFVHVYSISFKKILLKYLCVI